MVKSMKKRRKYIIVSILFAILGSIAASADTSFTVDHVVSAIKGRRFAVDYTLTTDDQSIAQSVSQPTGNPEIDKCTFLSGPNVTQGQSVTMINGYMTAEYTVSFRYIYRADEVGSATTPTISVTAGGKKYTAKGKTFDIIEDNAPQRGQQGQQGRQGNQQRRQGRERVLNSTVGTTKQSDLLVTISFSRNTVYEMEPIIATIKVCIKYDNGFEIDGSTFNVKKLPVYDGFLSEELPTSREMKIENIGGTVYSTQELKRTLLYPQKSGKLTVQSGEYDITVIEFDYITMGYLPTRREVPRKMSTATNTATVNVLPLPEPKPAGFSGAVGNFTITSELNPEIVRSNESSTYSMLIKGTGNLQYLTAPSVTFPSTFETYTPKTEIDGSFNGSNYVGTFRADYPFVPQESGKYNIAKQPFIYFNPETKQYVTIEAPGFDLNILRGNATAVVTNQKTISTEMTDILHIHPNSDQSPIVATPVFYSAWYKAIFPFGLIALAVIVLIYRRNVKRAADVTGRRLARANRVVSKRFKTAAAYMKAHKSEQFYDALAIALKGYIGDKLVIAQSQLISDTINDKLHEYGADDATCDLVLNVLSDCEMARFTPSQSDQAMSEVYRNAETAVKAIESIKK